MGQILSVHRGPLIPAQDVNMTLKMVKLPRLMPLEKRPKSEGSRREFLMVGSAIAGEGGECEVAIDGLFWQNTETGEFDVSSDITEYVEVDWGT